MTATTARGSSTLSLRSASPQTRRHLTRRSIRRARATTGRSARPSIRWASGRSRPATRRRPGRGNRPPSGGRSFDPCRPDAEPPARWSARMRTARGARSRTCPRRGAPCLRRPRPRNLRGPMRLRHPAALLTALALLAPAAAGAAVTPPPPTGRAPVGLVRLTLTDHQRTEHLAAGGGARMIPLRAWYPASRPGRRPGEVLTTAEQNAYESLFELPADALDGVNTTTTAAAPAAPGKHPVILLSPGWGNSTAFHDAQASDLASRGYVVIGIDHPGDTLTVDVGDGRLLEMNPAGEEIIGDSYVERVADLRYVLHHLDAVHGAGRLDRERIGAYGHSLGARDVAGGMLVEPRIKAGANLDGLAQEPVLSRGLDQPYAIADGSHPQDTGDTLEKLIAKLRRHLRGPHPLRHFPTTEHAGFTDNVWLVPQLGLDPAGQELGTIKPAAAVAGQRRFLHRFFDRYLRSERQ